MNDDSVQPLQISLQPVPTGSTDTPSSNDVLSWEMLETQIMPHPWFPQVSIRIQWEQQRQEQNKQRIAVYSGPETSPFLHVSLALPEEAVYSKNSLVLTDLQGNNTILCVLVQSNLLVLYDIYPSKDSTLQLPFDGWNIPLPFDCVAIFPSKQCLLLQRLEDEADADVLLTDPASMIPSPPFTTPKHQNNNHSMTASMGVSSLFTLHHPLHDVLPVVEHGSPVTDVYETVVWTDQDYMVTYHTQYNRHAVWKIVDCQPPPHSLKLFERTKQQYGNSLFTDTTNYRNPTDWDYLQWDGQQQPPTVSRQEALADALGVRRTPRKSLSNPQQQQQPHTGPVAATPGILPTDLYAKVGLENLTSLPNRSDPEPARKVFLAQTIHQKPILCLLKSRSLQVLALFPTSKRLGSDMQLLGEMPCVDAQPIVTTPQSTDILLLTTSGELVLFRGMTRMGTLRLQRVHGTVGTPTSFAGAVHDRFGLTLQDDSYEQRHVWGQLRLTLDHASSLAEAMLSVVDAALDKDKLLAAQIRMDACRLFYANAETKTAGNDLAFVAVQTVLQVVVRASLGVSPVSTVADRAEEPSAWEKLMQSEYHGLYQEENSDYLPDCDQSGDLLPDSFQGLLVEIGSLAVKTGSLGRKGTLFSDVFDSLVFLYEEARLKVSDAQNWTSKLAAILVDLCLLYRGLYPSKTTRIDPFLKYFRSSMNDSAYQVIAQSPTSAVEQSATTFEPTFSRFLSPPSIFEWIEGMLRHHDQDHTYGGVTDMEDVNAACTKTRSVLRLFVALIGNNRDPHRDLSVVQVLIEEGYTEPTAILENFPPGVAVPILEVLHRCRNFHDLSEANGWDSAAWSVIGRQDLCKNANGERVSLFDFAEPAGLNPDVPSSEEKTHEAAEDGNDGLLQTERSAAVFFPSDNRTHEAARLLRSSRPIFLRVPRAVEVSDHDYERLKQKRLLVLSLRSLALSVGRGMMTVGNLNPVPAETLPLPDLCLKGRVPPSNATLNLDISECPPDMKVWPEFHNGVAAGMRLPVAGKEAGGFSATRSWILFNRPPFEEPPESQESGDDTNQPTPTANYSHGGVILALGLRGHLKALELSDVYNYLTQGNVTTTIGMLLGLASNYRGTCDIAVSKTICLHIPSIIPQHFSAIDVASSVQTAGVTSVGLLYQGSSHRMMTEFLLNEIGKRPESDVNTSDREAYTLACGLALGSVNLCLGEQKESSHRRSGIADLDIEDRLIRYIIGGVDPDESDRAKESNDRFTLRSAESGNDNEKCSVVYEGELINTDVTAPGAILALGLMYLKTENTTVANAIALPDTHFLLEFVRPDFLGLRVVSRALICWNDVRPTGEWIDKQIPFVVRDAFKQMETIAKNAFGLRSPNVSAQKSVDYDRRAIRQMYAHVVAGACFGMGLRYAGTGNQRAKKALLERLSGLHALREASDPVSVALRPELPILETCLGCVAISLAMVMAGSGDLEVLRLFKIIRWRCQENSKYGMHLVYGMAIGLLFLGGGTCTLGREPADIAAMITAFFPKFPMVSSDNQYHLQALRHLYALAVKRRDLRAVDVETGESVSVPVEITTSDPVTSIKLTVPCLLPNSDSPYRELLVRSDKYYPLTLNLDKATNVFFVKRRKSQQSRDPFLLRNVLSQTFQIESLTDDIFLRAYAKFVMNDSDFATRSLLQCITEDKQEALFVYLSLQQQDPINLQLIQAYYQTKKRVLGDDESLLDTESLLPSLLSKTS